MQSGIHLELGQNTEANISLWERGDEHISVIIGHQGFSLFAGHRGQQIWHSSNLTLKTMLGKSDPAPPNINRKISVNLRAQ